jgi:dephospho-CoA kinase
VSKATPPIVGLTGGIASGKSSAEAAFRALGVPVLDADHVARDVVAPGSVGLAAIIDQFGPEFLTVDGQLDRRRMRERVFAHPAERKRLEALIHPLIGEAMDHWCQSQADAPYAVLSIAILLESRFRERVDFILVVDVAEAMQIERLRTRDHIDDTLARQMLAAQASREARREAADGLIDNSHSLEALQTQVATWHQHFLTRWRADDAV